MQPAVEELMKLGALPSSQNTDITKLEKFQNLLSDIEKPISDDEARALILLFGPDDCFGIGWTLLHLIDTSPGWPIEDCLIETGNPWVDQLRERAKI